MVLLCYTWYCCVIHGIVVLYMVLLCYTHILWPWCLRLPLHKHILKRIVDTKEDRQGFGLKLTSGARMSDMAFWQLWISPSRFHLHMQAPCISPLRGSTERCLLMQNCPLLCFPGCDLGTSPQRVEFVHFWQWREKGIFCMQAPYPPIDISPSRTGRLPSLSVMRWFSSAARPNLLDQQRSVAINITLRNICQAGGMKRDRTGAVDRSSSPHLLISPADTFSLQPGGVQRRHRGGETAFSVLPRWNHGEKKESNRF